MWNSWTFLPVAHLVYTNVLWRSWPVLQFRIAFEGVTGWPPCWFLLWTAAVMPPEHQCMPPCYSSNNQMKAVADIHRYRYKYMWHVYVYIYIWYTYTFQMEHCEQFHCHLRDPKVSCVQGRWLSELFHSCFCWIFHLSQGLCHATSIFQRIGHHDILPQRNSQRREDKG